MARKMLRLIANSITPNTVKPLTRNPKASNQTPPSILARTSAGSHSQNTAPSKSSAHCQQKNFTVSAEDDTPAGTPCRLRAYTCMGWPPVAAGVMEE